MEHNGSLFEALKGNIYGEGNSQTLVMAHGFGSTQSVWQYVIPLLACYFKVVVFDLAFSPNVGPEIYDPKKYSDYDGYADDLVCVLDELKVDKAIYLGHSMSAMIGCIASLKNPQLFHHLIFLGGSPRYLNDNHGYMGGFEKSDIDVILKQIKENYTSWVQSFGPKAIGVKDKKAILEFEHSLIEMNPSRTLDVAKAVFLSDYRWILPQVKVPTTIIQSKIDFVVPEYVASYMLQNLGGLSDNASSIILQTQGHFPQLTAPSLLLNILSRVFGIQEDAGHGQCQHRNLHF